MLIAPINCRLALCNSQLEETNLSISLRIASIVLGMMTSVILSCMLFGTHCHHSALFAILSVNIGCLIASALLKCVKPQATAINMTSTALSLHTPDVKPASSQKKRLIENIFNTFLNLTIQLKEIFLNNSLLKCNYSAFHT